MRRRRAQLGGLLAQIATWERPDLVAGLVLVDPSHEALWLNPPHPEDVPEWARFSDPDRPARDDARAAGVREFAAELAVDIARRRAGARWPRVPMVTLTAMKGRPAEYAEPVLELQEQLAARTGARHVVVPDSGHYIHVDRPDLVIRAVRDVLADA